eukprot:9546208-Alexandrium_andersonii.AAC.1
MSPSAAKGKSCFSGLGGVRIAVCSARRGGVETEEVGGLRMREASVCESKRGSRRRSARRNQGIAG